MSYCYCSRRIATAIPMMGPAPSASDPVQNANMLRNFLMLTQKKEPIMFFPECIN
jgi:hypothetical protein